MIQVHQYKSLSNSIYSLNLLTQDNILPHCDTYLSYIELANNSVIQAPERIALAEEMSIATDLNQAFNITRDSVELGFLYVTQLSHRSYAIHVLHTYDIDPDPIPKLLLINKVYQTYPIAWYLPKDIYTMQNIAILSPQSHRGFRYAITPHIRLQAPLWDDTLLDYLNLEVLV